MVFLCSRLIALALLIPKVTLESQIGPPSPKLRPIENVYFTEHRNIYFAEHRMSTLLNYVVKLLVLQGSDNFRAKFTVWLACPMVWLGSLKEKKYQKILFDCFILTFL